MDVHTEMKDITQEQLAHAHEEDLKNEKQEGVHFMKAWADPASGKVFCLSEGPNREAVQRVHEKSGHAADEIYEVPIEVE
jgi:hypothetical protein